MRWSRGAKAELPPQRGRGRGALSAKLNRPFLWKPEKLITPMATGRRLFATDPQVRMVGWWRALLLALLSAGAVYALVAWGQS